MRGLQTSLGARLRERDRFPAAPGASGVGMIPAQFSEEAAERAAERLRERRAKARSVR